MIGIFWLFSKLKHTGSICGTLFDLEQSSELPQKPWHHGHNNKKWLKQPQSHFYRAVPSKSCHFSLFWCILCTATPYISRSMENINSMARVSRLSFRFFWLWWNSIFAMLAFENLETLRRFNLKGNYIVEFCSLVLMLFLTKTAWSISWPQDCPAYFPWRSRPDAFYRKNVLKNFAKFIGKHLCQSQIFNKATDLRPATVLNKRLRSRCALVNFLKSLRTTLL